jgi:hypothetical protein
VCGLECSGGATKCGSACVDTKLDPAHCGGCGTACAAGQVCSGGTCSLTCVGGTTKCGNACVNLKSDPANCGTCGLACGDGKACVSGVCISYLYTFSGVQTNVPIASLQGWTQCYADTYANSGTSLATIQAQCNQARLLLGCRLTGSSTLITAANAPRADVLFDTTADRTTLHTANGVGWYFNSDWSWGYAQAGDAVDKYSCDIATSGSNDKRMCWHTGGGYINDGWRCGTAINLNNSNAYERLIFQAP